MNDVERTVDLFTSGLNCAQSVLTVFGTRYGVDAHTAKTLGRPLGGGLGHMALTCGAVTAAVLILGFAKDGAEEGPARKATFVSTTEFFARFEALHGTTECRNLLGADFTTEAGSKRIREEGLVRKTCPPYVRDAAAILEKMLEEGRG